MPSLRLAFWVPFVILAAFRPATVDGQYTVNPETAGPTSGGGTITITGTWNPAIHTPIVSIHGMLVAAASLWMTSTSLSIRVPAGPGCTDPSLKVETKDCHPLTDPPCDGGPNTQERVSVATYNYDPPTIIAVLPSPAQFGDGTASMTIFGHNFGRSACTLPDVQVSNILRFSCPSPVWRSR